MLSILTKIKKKQEKVEQNISRRNVEHVIVPHHLPYIVVTSTDMAASCKAVELRINP